MITETKETITKEMEIVKDRVWTCDICGKTTKSSLTHDFAREGNWHDGSSFDFKSAVVATTEGTCLPDCGDMIKKVYDVCPDCFDEKIVPLFKNAPRTVETDW